jgi:MFS family permease
MAALGFARHLVVIGVLTALVGFFTELYRPAVSAAIADLVTPSARTRAYGYMYWAINVGAALAPIAAGFLAHLDYLLLFIGDAITTLIYGFIVLWRIRETQPADAQRAAQAPMGSRVRQLASEPILLVMTGLTLIFGLVYMQGFVTLPLDMQNHGLGPSAYGLAAAANGILVVLITIQLSKAVAKWPHFGVMALAALLTGAGFGMNAWATTLPAYILAVGVWTLGEILVNAVAPTIIAELSPVQLRGLYQGIFGSAWGLAFFVGPLLGGWVFGAFSPDVLWLSCAVLGGVVAAGFLALSRAVRRPPAPRTQGSATA